VRTQWREGSLTFRPRYPLASGVTYYAVFHPPGSAPVEATFHGPEPVAGPEASVTTMYPSSPVLPANQLKLYIVFFRSHARRRFLAEYSSDRSGWQTRLLALCWARVVESRQYPADPDLRSRPHQTWREAKCGSRAGARGRKALHPDHRSGVQGCERTAPGRAFPPRVRRRRE